MEKRKEKRENFVKKKSQQGSVMYFGFIVLKVTVLKAVLKV